MKMNKKLVVSSLAICMGAGLVGSVSGTVAWYQYSTRTAINMVGTSVGVSKTLEIGIGGDGVEHTAEDTEFEHTEYKGGLSIAEIDAYLKNTVVEDANEYSDGTTLSPITNSVALSKNTALDKTKFVGNPIAGVKDMANWIAAEKTDFVVLPLWIRAVEKDGGETKYPARKIGMSDVSIDNKSVEGKQDITDAVRVHVNCGEKNALVANVAETITCGELDLDGIPGSDKEAKKYEWENAETVKYGTADSKQESYNLKSSTDAAALLVDDVYDKTNNPTAYKGGYDLGTTPTDGTGLNVNVVVWLEGWQALTNMAKNDAKVWDTTSYIGSQFYLGITFCCPME